jgi:AmmeMemoRadiSam system protein B
MPTRLPAVAGSFYPLDPTLLRREVAALLAAAEAVRASALPRAVLCPHAGYRYSGLTAAHAFARASGHTPRRVVLLGRSHHYSFHGISPWPTGNLATPLGLSTIDSAFTARVLEGIPVASPDMHGPEHALEVMLPFVQHVYGAVPVVALLFGAEPSSFALEFGRRLAETLSEEDLLVLSTDLSHFLDEPAANAIDQRTLTSLRRDSPEEFLHAGSSGEISLCGATAVAAGLACMEAAGVGGRHLLDYRTSAWASGDRSRVVGYAAMSFERN